MLFKQLHYRWQFDLQSSPEQLWPLVADTNRFNRDTGVPAVEALSDARTNARRRLRLSALGMAVEWEEQPFEWVRPQRFGVTRRYTKGPMAELSVLAELTPVVGPETEGGAGRTGTKLVYEIRARPRNLLGAIAIPIQIGILSARNFARTFRQYDDLARYETPIVNTATDVQLAPGGRARLISLGEKVIAEGVSEKLAALLIDHVETGDEFALSRIRPYQLAGQWNQPRRAVLYACFQATRAGILDLQWNLLCPMCRGGDATNSLKELSSSVHCGGCNIDFSVNFEQSVELTFRPNPSIREVDVESFCIGGPQVTPHIAAQLLLAPHSRRAIDIQLSEGRYRLRTMNDAGWQHLRVTPQGAPGVVLRASPEGWSQDELEIGLSSDLQFENATDEERLFILERTQWSDEAATAAEVTALQMFRDLFATEALRPGEQISVGTLTVLFTDLKDSTRLYREIGDVRPRDEPLRCVEKGDCRRRRRAGENDWRCGDGGVSPPVIGFARDAGGAAETRFAARRHVAVDGEGRAAHRALYRGDAE